MTLHRDEVPSRARASLISAGLALVLGVLAIVLDELAIAGVALPFMLVALGLAGFEIVRHPGRNISCGLALAAVGTILAAISLLSIHIDERPEAIRRASADNLQRIALAMHDYADAHGGVFPPPALHGKKGRPLLSWRVQILPYLGQGDLYRKFRLDEPWDSPHNSQLLSSMPKVYVRPGRSAAAERYATIYQVFVGPGTLFETEEGLPVFYRRYPESPDVLLVVEAGTPVPWTKPADLLCAQHKPLPPLGGLYTDLFTLGKDPSQGRFGVVSADGRVEQMLLSSDEKIRQAIYGYDEARIKP